MDIDGLTVELTKQLSKTCQEITDEVIDICDKVSNEARKKLWQNSPKKTGEYAKGWRKKKEIGELKKFRIVLYNPKKGYLTHLLENGHLTRDGKTRTRPTPHIAPIEKWAIEEISMRIDKL